MESDNGAGILSVVVVMCRVSFFTLLNGRR